MSTDAARDALTALIRGSGVHRASHDLQLAGRDNSNLFAVLLAEEGYRPMQVDDVDIEPGERVPAFFLQDGIAHFGWVFWEVFFSGRMRKIYGSSHRNEKGDWAIIMGKGCTETIYVNAALKESMDINRPSEF
ncbi:MAG: hypothetical protein ABIG68_10325 [Acidobacteriota bacterium]